MLKCYLTFPFGMDTSPFRNILLKSGIEIIDVYDIPKGVNIREDIRRKISESSFVIAIIGEDSFNVAFEIGLSEGLNKPVLILNTGKYDLPLDLIGTTVIDILPNKEILLEKAVSNFINSLKSEHSKLKRSIYSSVWKKAELKKILVQTKLLRNNAKHNATEQLIYKYFEALGVSIIGSELKVGGNTTRADFSIWVPEIETFVKNPILVELKVGQLSTATLQSATAKLTDWVNKVDLQMGILIYLDTRNKRFELPQSKFPLIAAFDFEDIINQTISFPLSKILLQQRNLIMHGGSSL